METIAKIRRLYHVKGKGFKTIARELKLSKNTVKKIIRSDETVSVYQRQQQGYPILEKYKEKIQACRYVLSPGIATSRNTFRQMTLRRDAWSASPVHARLSRAPHLAITHVIASMIRR